MSAAAAMYQPLGASVPQAARPQQQQQQNAAAPDDGRETLLVTMVDIGEGRSGRIEVREGDDPIDVARAFCARHGLPEDIVLPLAQHLEDNLAAEQEHGEEGAAAVGGEEDEGYAPSPPGFEQQQYEQHAQEQQNVAPPAPAQPSAAAGAAPTAQRPGSAAAASRPGSHQAEQQQARRPMQQQAEERQQQVEASARSAGHLGSRPHSRQADQQARPSSASARQHSGGSSVGTAPLSYRPAAIHSARGAEYFNRLPASSRSADSDSGSNGNGGGGSGGAVLYRPATSGGSGGIGGSGGGGLAAHTRLYADHFRKQQRLEEERRLRDLEIQLKTEQVHIAPVSNKLAGHRTAGSYRNYGERLYSEGRLEAIRREQEAQRQKEEEERAELEGLTFQPSISPLAHQIKQAEASGGVVQAGERLYQRAQGTAKRQERMEAIRREQDEAEVSECSFHPQINSKSARMVEQRQQILRETGLAGYDQLYNDSMRRRMKLEALAAQPPEEATFKPRVNTSSVVLKKLMEGRDGDGLLAGTGDVAARLLERGRRYQEKLAAAQRQAVEEPRDASTGQLLFKPKTHRPPVYERNPDGAPIGEYLHSIKAEWDEKAARVRHSRERQAQQNAASTFVNGRSERLVDRLKRERFRAVFDYLRQGQPSPVLNLLETVQDDTFMDTIDPEVRADVEYAGKMLAKSISRRQASERLRDCATSAAPGGAASGGDALDTSRTAGSYMTATTGAGGLSGGSAGPAYGQSTNGEVDAAGFVALMEEVISRTKGITRQYLLPMPSGRQKFEEPTFRPAIDPHSQALAARVRPEALPAYEILYKTAEETAAKREEQRRMAEQARLKECLFKPVLVTQAKAQEGRAMKLAAELTQSKRTSEGQEGDAPQQGQAATPAPAHQSSGAIRSATPEALRAAAVAAAAALGPAAAGPDGEQLHFETLERQINEALVRLSMSEEQMVAAMRAGDGEATAAAGAGQAGPAAAQPVAGGNVPVGQSMDANGYHLDWRAICGTPSPEMGDTPGVGSSMAFNPCVGDEAEEAAGGAVGPSGVAWEADSQEVVAHVMADTASGDAEAADGTATVEPLAGGAAAAKLAGQAGPAAHEVEMELSGLDLHALASTDLPEHDPSRP